MRREEIIAGIEEARKKFSRLIEHAEKGLSVTILRHGRPVVKFVPVNSGSEQKRQKLEELRARREIISARREFAARVRSYIEYDKSRREAEKAVRLSERRLRRVLESASEAILETDGDGKILLFNRAAERMFGYGRNELQESMIEQLVPASMRELHAGYREEYVRDPQIRPMGMGMELKAQKKDGSLFPVEIGLSPYRVDGTLRVIVLVHDVTQRKQIERAFQQSEDKVRQAEKLEALARMAGGTAHEFNNLLTMVMGYSALMLSALDSKRALVDYVEKITRASKRAAELTHQLLAFSRHQMLAPQTVDMNIVLAEVRQILPSLIGRNIEISLTPAPQPALIRADRSQIHQVMIHMIFNARDAMPDGGKLAIRMANIELTARDLHKHPGLEPGKYVQLTVSDTGVGMAREVQSRLFEPFFTTKDFGKGSGLNMAAIYGIVQQSRGSISVQSAPGAGTTFTILLPQASNKELPAGKARTQAAGVQRGTETILLVEDEASLRTLTREFLQGLGYDVLAAADGEEALRTAAQHHGQIDLLLTDVIMPGMSGQEIARQLVPLRAGIKVLFISGYVDDVLAGEGITHPEQSFLEKPFSFEDLAQKIREVLKGGDTRSAQDANPGEPGLSTPDRNREAS